MKSLIGRMIVIGALALSANTAVAATTHAKAKPKPAVHAAAVHHPAPAKRVASRQRRAPANPFQLVFGGPGAYPQGMVANPFQFLFGWPGVNLPRVAAKGAAENDYVSQAPPISDSAAAPPAVDIAQQESQDAIDRANQDLVDQSMQMAATQAAVNEQEALDTENTLQTEINAGM